MSWISDHILDFLLVLFCCWILFVIVSSPLFLIVRCTF